MEPFPGSKKNKATESTIARKEILLTDLYSKFFFLTRDCSRLELLNPEDSENFLRNLNALISGLLLLKPFEDNPELITDCREVLVLTNNKDITQGRKYLNLINRILETIQKRPL